MDTWKLFFLNRTRSTMFYTFSTRKVVTPVVLIGLCSKTEKHFNKFFNAGFLVLMLFQNSSAAHWLFKRNSLSTYFQ